MLIVMCSEYYSMVVKYWNFDQKIYITHQTVVINKQFH